MAILRPAQHHPAAVEAEKLGQQMQHFADDQIGVEALAHQAGGFADHQQFLVVQAFGGQGGRHGRLGSDKQIVHTV